MSIEKLRDKPKVPGNDWYIDRNPSWPGIAVALRVDEVLHQSRSKYQDIKIIRNSDFGNALLLDDVLQLVERDEFMYHEMMVNLPLFAHPNPRNILIVGGGDGGVAREVLKHSCVENVVLCELDEEVIEVSKKHLATSTAPASVFSNPKLRVHVEDGFEFLRKCARRAKAVAAGDASGTDVVDPDVPVDGLFDVIITDCTDAVEGSPGEALYEAQFYELINGALRPDGISCALGGSPFMFLPLLQRLVSVSKAIYPKVGYAMISVSSFTTGHEGFIICSRDPHANLADIHPARLAALPALPLRFYNREMHRAALQHPKYMREAFGEDDAPPS